MVEHGDGLTATISVAAGKGGTGKTLLATSLALSLNSAYPGRVQILDCDVEEPNAHLLLRPQLVRQEAVTVPVPEVDLHRCTRCGRCAEVCQNSAIAVVRRAVLTFPELCSGCGACSYVCGAGAISEEPHEVGIVSSGSTAEGIEFHTGRLNVGDLKASPITRAVKRHVRRDMVSILDAPPGTACPMQEAVADSDYCILVTEPTPFGLSDLRGAVATCRATGVPCGVVINRHGSGYWGVEHWCDCQGLRILEVIPHDRCIAEAYSRGEAVLGTDPEWSRRLLDMAGVVIGEIGHE